MTHPEIVRALVISGVTTDPPRFSDPWALGVLDRQQRSIAAADIPGWLDATVAYATGPHRTLGDLDPGVVALLRRMQQDFVRHVRPGVVPPQPVPDAWQHLGSITVPTLGIPGTLDSPDHLRMTSHVIEQVSQASLTEIAGAGHMVNLE